MIFGPDAGSCYASPLRRAPSDRLLFLFHTEFDHHGSFGLLRALQTAASTSARWVTTQPGEAMRLGNFDEIGATHGHGGVTLLEEKLLPLAHHAQVTVVHDGNVDLDALLGSRGQFRLGHLEAAVAGNRPHLASGRANLAPIAAGQAKTHRARPARGDAGVGLVMLVILRRPHLVLTHIRDDQRIAFGVPPEIVDHVRRIQLAIIGQVLNIRARRCRPSSRRSARSSRRDRRPPRGTDSWLRRFMQIADQGQIHRDILIHFRRIDFDVDFLGVAAHRS